MCRQQLVQAVARGAAALLESSHRVSSASCLTHKHPVSTMLAHRRRGTLDRYPRPDPHQVAVVVNAREGSSSARRAGRGGPRRRPGPREKAEAAPDACAQAGAGAVSIEPGRPLSPSFPTEMAAFDGQLAVLFNGTRTPQPTVVSSPLLLSLSLLQHPACPTSSLARVSLFFCPVSTSFCTPIGCAPWFPSLPSRLRSVPAGRFDILPPPDPDPAAASCAPRG